MNGEKTYQGFIDFIKAQPSSRRTHHRSGWNGCMVGDYVQGEDYMESHDFAENIIRIHDPDIFKALNAMGMVFPRETTYGETLEYLESKGLL